MNKKFEKLSSLLVGWEVKVGSDLLLGKYRNSSCYLQAYSTKDGMYFWLNYHLYEPKALYAGPFGLRRDIIDLDGYSLDNEYGAHSSDEESLEKICHEISKFICVWSEKLRLGVETDQLLMAVWELRKLPTETIVNEVLRSIDLGEIQTTPKIDFMESMSFSESEIPTAYNFVSSRGFTVERLITEVEYMNKIGNSLSWEKIVRPKW